MQLQIFLYNYDINNYDGGSPGEGTSTELFAYVHYQAVTYICLIIKAL
jgi:hypothetical protein